MGTRALFAALVLVACAAMPAFAQDVAADWETHTRAAVKAFGLAQMDVATNEATLALDMAEKNFKPGDERTQTSVANLFSIEKGNQNWDKAIALGQRLEDMQRKADADDPSLAIFIGMLADTYRDKGDAANAVTTYTRALVLYDKIMGEVDPLTVGVRENFAVALAKFGRDDEAIKLWNQVISDWGEALGPDHLRRSISLAGLIEELRKVGRTKEADTAEIERKRIQDIWDARR